VTANLISQYVPTYQYLMSFKNSFGLLQRIPLPSKIETSTFIMLLFCFAARGFDLGVSHADDLQLLSKLQEDAAYVR